MHKKNYDFAAFCLKILIHPGIGNSVRRKSEGVIQFASMMRTQQSPEPGR